MNKAFSLSSFPRAIIHIDADSFFASCEQSLHPEYRNKPLITGKERGIASAVSIEAKKLGISRGMSISEIKKICPNIIYTTSDYETYSLISKRMFEIVRRYTSLVEEYGIDECFAEITGLRRPLRMSYTDIVKKIKSDLETELGMTFSIGLGPSKVTAKLGSKHNKPSGMTILPARELHNFLQKIPVEKVWGIGEQTRRHMNSLKIQTALDFASKDYEWVKSHFTKPHQEIWKELRGESVIPLETEEKKDYKSISKTKTFTPPSCDRSYLLSQLSKNTENACIKSRRHNLVSNKIYLILRSQDFKHSGYEIKLSRSTNIPQEIIKIINANLDKIYRPGVLYRATGVVLADLEENLVNQGDLFGEDIKSSNAKKIYEKIDFLSEKFGKHTVFLGSSFLALKNKQHSNERGDLALRNTNLFRGENNRQRIGIPMLGDVS